MDEKEENGGFSAFIPKLLAFIANLLAVIGVLLIGFFLLLYFAFGPKNMPVAEASRYTRIGPADTVLHARYGVRWLDSQRYFVIRPPREEIDKVFKGAPEIDPEHPEDYVPGKGPMHGKYMWTPGEGMPSWWDVAEQPVIIYEDKWSEGRHDGETRIYSKENGLIYVIDR